MHVGKVIGTVWATKKQSTLEGLRLLLVRPLAFGEDEQEDAQPLVSVDVIGAGIGEIVLVAHGRAARYTIGRGQDIALQTAVVGIVDEIQLQGGRVVRAK
jgi:ethanolamine utilization protein EutN